MAIVTACAIAWLLDNAIIGIRSIVLLHAFCLLFGLVLKS